MVHCRDVRLHVYARPALVRGADQYLLFAAAHLLEKRLPLCIGFCVVYESDFLCRDSLLYQLGFQVVVNVKLPAVPDAFLPVRRPYGFWCADVRENKLAADFTVLVPGKIFGCHVCCYLVQFPVRVVRRMEFQKPCVRP